LRRDNLINTLDLSYYPSEERAYNNDVNFAADPAANFGGIMRSLNSTNFEQCGLHSILGDGSLYWKGAITQNNSGKLYFNLGDI
jgi:cell surface protein SprA